MKGYACYWGNPATDIWLWCRCTALTSTIKSFRSSWPASQACWLPWLLAPGCICRCTADLYVKLDENLASVNTTTGPCKPGTALGVIAIESHLSQSLSTLLPECRCAPAINSAMGCLYAPALVTYFCICMRETGHCPLDASMHSNSTGYPVQCCKRRQLKYNTKQQELWREPGQSSRQDSSNTCSAARFYG